MPTVRKGFLLVLIVLLVLLVVAGAALAAKPSRVLIITFDQMRPEYAQQYNMTNFLDLQKSGLNFNKAYVGQMASETVVSHATIVSGLFPKHVGYSDEVMRDVNGILYQPAGQIVTTGDMNIGQFTALANYYGYPKLGDYMHEADPDSVVANFGEKGYQVFTTAASSSDYYARMGSTVDCSTTAAGRLLPWADRATTTTPAYYRGPSGVFNWPESTVATDSRFLFSSGNSWDTYGTTVTSPAYLYPEDGRYAPGEWDDHRGGDAWVADAAIRFMDEMPNWSAIHLNFSGIDKIGHMWGGPPSDTVAWQPDNLLTEVHMAFQATNADAQLAKLEAEMKGQGTWDQTLVVLLADHGSTWAENPHYVDSAGGGNLSWYYDPNNKCKNTTYGRTGANNPALAPLDVDHNLAYSYQSTAIEAWLIDQSWTKKVAEADAMKTMPGVIATYIREGNHYVLASTNAMSAAEKSWWKAHGQELVDTMAWSGAADVVGLLKDKTSYGVYGDHGGAQQDVQRIPMVFWAKGIHPATKGTEFRLVDVLPTVLRNMGIAPTAPMDGLAYNLNIK
jgi:hypothetical protein